MLDGAPPRLIRLAYALVDVRDVVDLHLRAMLHPAAAGERFLATAGEAMTMEQIAHILRDRLGNAASRVPTKTLPDWAVRVAGLFSAPARQFAPSLGTVRRSSNEKAKRILGWAPRPVEQTVVETAESLLRLRSN
jgi:dihydroflavonol-4-reductase